MLEAVTGTETWVKHENNNPTGAFKVRGGLRYVSRLLSEEPALVGLIAATRGNHGQSIAFAGSALGVPVTIVAPESNSPDKNAAMRALGADLVLHGHDFQESVEHANRLAAERGLTMVPSFHRWLVEGVATYAAELHESVRGLDTVYVPVGMGSGICANIAVRDLFGLRTEVVGVVSELAPAYALSYDAGRPVSTPTADTFVDGVACRTPDPDAVTIITHGAARIVRVSERQAAEAMVDHVPHHPQSRGAGRRRGAGRPARREGPRRRQEGRRGPHRRQLRLQHPRPRHEGVPVTTPSDSRRSVRTSTRRTRSPRRRPGAPRWSSSSSAIRRATRARRTPMPVAPKACGTTRRPSGIDLYVHSPYLINVATTNNRIRIPGRKLLQQHIDGAAAIGAKGLIVHGGHLNKDEDPAIGFDNWRKAVEATDLKIPLLIENTAGGDNAMTRYLDRIAGVWDAIASAPGSENVGFCLDTCHAHAGGNPLETIVKDVLAITGRIDLVHCNDSRDEFDSGADRHANLGNGKIDPELLASVVREAGAPVICETPGGADEHTADFAWLRERL